MEEFNILWKDFHHGKVYNIATFTFNGTDYIFKYNTVEFNIAKSYGCGLVPGFFEEDKVYVSNELFPSIKERLGNTSNYLEKLAITGGIRMTDYFEFKRVK